MARFQLNAEHFRADNLDRVRDFVKGKGIRVTKAWMSEVFTNQVSIIISCPDKRGANKVQKFIWDNINGGTWCDIVRLK